VFPKNHKKQNAENKIETVTKLVNNLYFYKKILREFWEKHKDCEQQLKAWFHEAEKAEWENPNQIKEEYPSESMLNNNRVVFYIKGNH
jgi:mRNA interferase HigB